MKIYGNVTLSEGSDLKNLTVDHGSNYPSNPNVGELFFHTAYGLSVHDGTKWNAIGGVETNIELVYDGEFTVHLNENDVVFTTATTFRLGTTSLFVGGLRQKLGVDYEELNTSTIKLLYPLTQEDIDNGVNFSISWEPESATSETFIFNGAYTLTFDNDVAVITPQYKFKSIRVYVGGIRLKSGVDYTEVGSTTVQLNFPLTQADINAGENIVIDYAKLL